MQLSQRIVLGSQCCAYAHSHAGPHSLHHMHTGHVLLFTKHMHTCALYRAACSCNHLWLLWLPPHAPHAHRAACICRASLHISCMPPAAAAHTQYCSRIWRSTLLHMHVAGPVSWAKGCVQPPVVLKRHCCCPKHQADAKLQVACPP